MKQENEFVLPEKWSIKITKKNVDIIQRFKSKTHYKDHASKWNYCEYSGNGSDELYFDEITFDQFKEHVLKEIPKPECEIKDVAFNNEFETKCGWNKMNEYPEPPKKIIGYKLIKPEYKEAAEIICQHAGLGLFEDAKEYAFLIKSYCYSKIKEAGVLDIWFKPVYDESITLKSGIKLSKEDIEEIKQLIK